MAQIAIFYATGSKQIRGILVPDNDSDLARCYAPVGETMLIVPAFTAAKGVFDPANNQYVIDCVKKETGVTPPDPTCAVVNDKGEVEALIAADPAIDVLPGKVLVQAYSKEIAPGATYDAGSKQFTVPQRVIAATIDRDGQPTRETVIPAKTLSDVVLLQD